MVIILKQNAKKEEINELLQWVKAQNVDPQSIEGESQHILGLVGNTHAIDIDAITTFPAVESVRRIAEPYKKANRKFHHHDTIVDIAGYKIGGDNFQVIAGPCSVESEAQVVSIAKSVKQSGAHLLRGGAFKPRTSPYAFQGLKAEGIHYLLEAKKQTGMPIVSELMSMEHIDLFNDVDVIQVGARNMQNFVMLRELGGCNKPILLKRGLANTLEEFLMSAEYIMAGGNNNVILCERGIRSFDHATRNVLDLSAVPVLKRLTHLPVIIDPSHATGKAELVESMSLAAVAAGADGLIIEVHNNPKAALCDGAQSLDFPMFEKLMHKVNVLKECVDSLKD
ncbi:MAG: 3-deoxy-7-phosphoheptulonate synthase [Clostridiales bacterium]|nr:3-deoxy-7-phosphoheptulonate synthase [Clostridiales bacterium]